MTSLVPASFNIRSDEFAIYPCGFPATLTQPSIVLRVEHQQSLVSQNGRQAPHLPPAGSQSLHETLKPGTHNERYGGPPFLSTVKLLRERLFYLGGKEDDERKELKSNKLWESEIRFCHGSVSIMNDHEPTGDLCSDLFWNVFVCFVADIANRSNPKI